jgi:aldehyde:ferredoxin oxidoreductase
MFGWMGKILLVNLSTDKVQEEKLDLRILKDYIGGRGLGIHIQT